MRAHSVFIPIPLAHFVHRWAKILEINTFYFYPGGCELQDLILSYNWIVFYCAYMPLSCHSSLGTWDIFRAIVNGATMNIWAQIYLHINFEGILGNILISGGFGHTEVIFLIFYIFKTIIHRDWIKLHLTPIMDKISFSSISCQTGCFYSFLILVPIFRSWNYLCSKFPSTSTELDFPYFCYNIWNAYFEPNFPKWNR